MNEMTHLTADELAMLAKASKATRGKWSWSTSNSWRRLTSEGGRDGGVLCPVTHPYDKHPDCSISDEDMAHIGAANPDAVLKLLADLNAARAEVDRLNKRHVANVKARDDAREEADRQKQAALTAEISLDQLKWHLQVPEGAKRLDAWEYKGELIVCGTPHDSEDVDDPDAHNCDEMGCSSVSHVIIREKIDQYGRIAELEAARAKLAKLPKTADGVEIVPGMTLWPEEEMEDEKGCVVLGYSGVLVMDSIPSKGGDFILDADEVEGCYSTRESALAAKDAAEGRVG